MKSKVSIIIVHYSNISYTINCINSIINSKTEWKYSIIIIDNSKSKELLFPKKKINKKNVFVFPNKTSRTGFSSGIKCGLNHSKSEYIVILDNDTIVLNHWLDKLIEPFLSSSSIGITASKIIDDSRPGFILGGKINFLGFSYSNRVPSDISPNDNEKLFYGITSWCIKRKLLNKVGIDTEFQFFSDDSDIGFKVKSLGYEVIPTIDSIAIHLKPSKDKLMERERVVTKVEICNRDYLIFTYKNLNLIHFILFFNAFILLKIIFIPFRLVMRDTTLAHDLFGIVSFFSSKNKLSQRKKINQGIRKLRYWDIFRQLTPRFFVNAVIFK